MTARDQAPAWHIYHGDGREPHDDWTLPPPPPWRRFHGELGDTAADAAVLTDGTSDAAGLATLAPPAHDVFPAAASYRLDPDAAKLVNAALVLRRPLLVTGSPGAGKSTLAHSIAHELKLGNALQWNITSRSTLQDGLYSYDAIGRLQETQERRAAGAGSAAPLSDPRPSIGDYIRLGPLGTALLPRARPRVLLIDEIDKCDIDLPNDLLGVLELGEFTIDELDRLPEGHKPVRVMTQDRGVRATVAHGRVACAEFPIIVLANNGERPFPEAFMRRCIRVELARPDTAEKLAEIIESHFAMLPAELKPAYDELLDKRDELIKIYLDQQNQGHEIAVGQLIDALFLSTAGSRALGEPLQSGLLRPLNRAD